MSQTVITKVEAAAQTNDIPHSIAIVKFSMCSDPVPSGSVGNCDYYKKRYNNFLQRHPSKTPPEYYLKYGLYYCQLFKKETYPKLSEAGKIWLTKTLKLLQKYMEQGVVDRAFVAANNEKFNEDYHLANIYDDNNKPIGVTAQTKEFYKGIECKAENYTKNCFKDFAFATHPDAYRPHAMQKLPVGDLIQIAWTPDLKEWLDGRTWEQALIMYDKMDVSQIATRTAEEMADEAEKSIEESAKSASEILQKVFK